MIVDTIHLMGFVVLIVYVAVLFTVLENLWDARSLKSGHLSWWVWIFNGTLTIQASMFMFLQIDWIMNNYDSQIADVSASLWAVYDWANGVAMLAYGRILNIWINWDKLRDWR